MAKILLVGAGAVGLVYGRHLQLGGDEVHFLVKPKHAQSLRDGFDIYHLNKSRHGPPIRFEDFGVLTNLEEVAASRWDQLWICTSSTALKSGDWLGETIAAAGEETTVVGLQPGAQDRDYALQYCPAERLVWGLITFISYQTPLPDEDKEPGLAYWLPPLTPSLFFGPEARTRAVAQGLSKGGCSARFTPKAAAQMALGGAMFIPIIAGLEGAGWSFSRFKSSPLLDISHNAAREAVDAVANQQKVKVPLPMRMVRPWMVRMAIRLAPIVVPLPLEIYLEYHFTKVGDQTRQMLRDYVQLAQTASLPHAGIEALSGRLLPLPSHEEAV